MHKAEGGQDSPLKTNTADGQVRIPLQAQSPSFIKMPHFITETCIIMVERMGCEMRGGYAVRKGVLPILTSMIIYTQSKSSKLRLQRPNISRDEY